MDKIERNKKQINQFIKKAHNKDEFIDKAVRWVHKPEEEGGLNLRQDPFKTSADIRLLWDRAGELGKGKKVLISWIAKMINRIETVEGKKETRPTNRNNNQTTLL